MRAGTLTDYVSLTKPGVTGMVLATTAAGLYLGGAAPAPLTGAVTLVATALVVGSANALNCWMERESDKLMARTARRPLPAGRLDAASALVFGLALAALSLPLYLAFTDGLTTLVALVALASYVLVYTPLKRRSPLALLVGAVPGALPPLIGASAARGIGDPAGWALFALLFAWQVPHFVAIAVRRRDDYAAAGLRVVSVARGEGAARRVALGWSVVLWAASLAPWALGMAGAGYGVAALATGAAFVALAASAAPARRWATRLFVASLVHLTILSTLLVLA
jgi:protoheme IX farnesyltransferase